MSKSAIYAGSFDPLTNGHLDIITRGAALFDRLVVAIGVNPAKKTWFTPEERIAMVRAATASLPQVEVVAFSGLLIHTCVAQRTEVILRGLRALSDFDLEFRNGLANRDMSGIETVFLLSEPENIFVSSSLVKEIFANGGDVSRYVPASVLAALHARSPGR